MVRLSLAATLAALSVFAAAETPFPIAFESAPTSVLSKLEVQVTSWAAALETESAVMSLEEYMITATGLSPAEETAFDEAFDDPILLANEYFTATAVPTWLGDLPSPLGAFVTSAANQEAAYATQAVGKTGAAPAQGAPKVLLAGAVLGSMLFGMALL